MNKRNTGWGVHYGQTPTAPSNYGKNVRKVKADITTGEARIAYLENRLRFAPIGGRVFLEEALREARESRV